MAVNKTGRSTFIQAGNIRKFLGGHNREQTMKRFAIAASVVTLGLTATVPARADYALVRWDNGYCRVWWEASATPWGVGWAKIATAPEYSTATAVFDQAVQTGTCR
jgi:hypothetical protein